MSEQRLSSDSISSLLNQMKGLTVALATPLNEGHELDVAGLEQLIERVIAGGASCLFPLGWMGEQPLVSNSTRQAVMAETCRLAKDRLPVMVGVSEQGLPRALEQAEMAREAGADLILSTPPCSYHIPQALIYDYLQELAAASRLVGAESLRQLSEVLDLYGVDTAVESSVVGEQRPAAWQLDAKVAPRLESPPCPDPPTTGKELEEILESVIPIVVSRNGGQQG